MYEKIGKIGKRTIKGFLLSINDKSSSKMKNTITPSEIKYPEVEIFRNSESKIVKLKSSMKIIRFFD